MRSTSSSRNLTTGFAWMKSSSKKKVPRVISCTKFARLYSILRKIYKLSLAAICWQWISMWRHCRFGSDNEYQNLLWSGGTGQTGGTCGQHDVWHVKPQISHTIPCRIKPTISDVQWLHLVGLENVRTRNWCALCFIGDWDSCWKKWFLTVPSYSIILTVLTSDKLLFELTILGARLSSMSPSSDSIEPPW